MKVDMSPAAGLTLRRPASFPTPAPLPCSWQRQWSFLTPVCEPKRETKPRHGPAHGPCALPPPLFACGDLPDSRAEPYESTRNLSAKRRTSRSPQARAAPTDRGR